MIKRANLIVFLRDNKWQLLPPIGVMYRYHSRFLPPEEFKVFISFYLRPRVTQSEFDNAKIGGDAIKNFFYAKILLEGLHSIYSSTYSKTQLRRILSATSEKEYKAELAKTMPQLSL